MNGAKRILYVITKASWGGAQRYVYDLALASKSAGYEVSVAYGEPEYRNALCAQIGEKVAQASLEEGDALTIEFENGTVFGLSLREEDLDGPESGSYSETGDASDAQEF